MNETVKIGRDLCMNNVFNLIPQYYDTTINGEIITDFKHVQIITDVIAFLDENEHHMRQ